MPSSGILQFTQSLMTSKRFFGDDEIRDDTEWLRDFLKAASRELTFVLSLYTLFHTLPDWSYLLQDVGSICCGSQLEAPCVVASTHG